MSESNSDTENKLNPPITRRDFLKGGLALFGLGTLLVRSDAIRDKPSSQETQLSTPMETRKAPEISEAEKMRADIIKFRQTIGLEGLPKELQDFFDNANLPTSLNLDKSQEKLFKNMHKYAVKLLRGILR